MPSSSSTHLPDCPFCTISQTYPPISPLSAAPPLFDDHKHAEDSSDKDESSSETAYTILSTPSILAFLDHMPITRGHVLVITREHREKLSHCQTSEAAVLGAWLSVLSRAVMRGLGALASAEQDIQDWNVVQNNGARAAQVVKHVHYHIIPRPGEVPDLRARSWTMFGRGQRGDLDEEEALRTRDCIRGEIAKEVHMLSPVDRRILGIEDEGRGSRL